MGYKLLQVIKHNGGLKNSLKKLIRFDSLKVGCLVGKDKYGNKYYENKYYFYGTNRWIEYADHVHFDYDASQIPPEWYGWMHYKSDCPPKKDCRPQHKWMLNHSENLSGTKEAYMPYTTTREKIEVWNPKESKSGSPK